MRHRKSMRKLSRTSSHRWAMLRTMVTQLIKHERIKTTVPKAKELRRVADKMVTLAKVGELVFFRLASPPVFLACTRSVTSFDVERKYVACCVGRYFAPPAPSYGSGTRKRSGAQTLLRLCRRTFHCTCHLHVVLHSSFARFSPPYCSGGPACALC